PRGGGRGEVRGLIPTGWYPNSITVSADGRTLYVADGKSVEGPNPGNCRDNSGRISPAYTPSGCQLTTDYNGAENTYVLQLNKGDLLSIPVPKGDVLNKLTRQVAANNGFRLRLDDDAADTMKALKGKIKHVI